MKLFFSKTSPYARRIRAGLIVLGLNETCEMIEVSPFDVPQSLIQYNPLSQIPTLITHDEKTLTGSAVILEYINTQSRACNIFPKEDYWQLRHLSNIAEGIIDAALSIVLELRREDRLISQSLIEKQKQKIFRALHFLESQPLSFNASKPTGFSLTLAVALAYLEFRVTDLNWQQSCKNLNVFLRETEKQAWMLETQPPAV